MHKISWNSKLTLSRVVICKITKFVKVFSLQKSLYGILAMHLRIHLQWNPSKADTIGTKYFVRCSEVSLAQGLVVDHAPPTIVVSYDKAILE